MRSVEFCFKVYTVMNQSPNTTSIFGRDSAKTDDANLYVVQIGP